MGEARPVVRPPGTPRFACQQHAVFLGLTIYAVLAPLAVSAVGGRLDGPTLSTPYLGPLALALCLLGPVLAATVAAVRGLGPVALELRQRDDGEAGHAIIRIFLTGAVLAYLAALAWAAQPNETLLPLLAIDVPGICSAWLLFVHLLAHPAPSSARRVAAAISDVGFISIFLHAGGAVAAPWCAAYLLVIFGCGFRSGVKALIASTALSFFGFAAVYADTPFWQERPALTAAMFLALLLLPIHAAGLVRRAAVARRQLAEAFAARSRFLATIGRELRMPLNGIIDTAALIGGNHLDTEQRYMLGTMQHAARGLLALISDLLDLAELQAGKPAPTAESFALHKVLGGALASVRPQAEAKGLTLSLRIDPRLPSAYRGLPLQLRQILMNLLANAIKLTPRGRIALTGTLLGREGSRVRLSFAVRDQGVGIPDDARERIFEVFGRSEEKALHGSGLEPAIAKQLVELMGGTLTLQSEPGKGSSFSVELALEQETGEARPPDLLGRRVMLITADSEFAGLMRNRLRAWRGELHWLGDGEAAFADLMRVSDTVRPLVLLDGRDNALAALSLVHRCATAMPVQPLILFIAPAQGSEAIAGLAASRLAAVIEAPVSEVDLASMLEGVLTDETRMQGEADGAPASSATAASTLAAIPLKVLVADSNASNCRTLKTMLEAAGHEVQVAGDGEGALAALERGRFDVAVIDIKMPQMGGYEVAKLYRVSQGGDGRMAIVALTSEITAETERLCRDAGVDAVLTKPVEAEQLLHAIDEVHGRMAARDRLAVGTPVVTPISVHPRFAPEPGAIIDEAMLEALRNLGGNDFVAEVVETFRKDAWRLLDQLRNATEKSDLRLFREIVHSIRSGAANVGATKLCQTLAALRDVTVKDLRQSGAVYHDKIRGDLVRLEASIDQLVRDQRRG
jgi:two-component system sensor histidine kinase RpfC